MKKHDFFATPKKHEIWGPVTFGFRVQKWSKNASNSPPSEKERPKKFGRRRVFVLVPNGGVGGEQSGDVKTRLKLGGNLRNVDHPPPDFRR